MYIIQRRSGSRNFLQHSSKITSIMAENEKLEHDSRSHERELSIEIIRVYAHSLILLETADIFQLFVIIIQRYNSHQRVVVLL